MSETSTTVSVLTPSGRGAIAVIAVEGPQAAAFVERFFLPQSKRALMDRPLGTIVYGRWGDAAGEDVIVCRRSENQIEVHCHGGAAAPARIVADLTQLGAVEENWSNWIGRHETSRIRAAARISLANCTTQRAAAILLDQYNGALEAALREIVNSLRPPHPGPLLEGEGGFAKALAAVERLLARAPLGMHLTQPWRVVIAGPPNVGKSSLINALLGYQRAIVFDQPGTTRDVVTGLTALDGWPIELSDTAGLRASDDALETAGVERTVGQALKADLLILVFDASQPWSAACQELVDAWPAAFVVRNKCDLPAIEKTGGLDSFLTSALTGEGIELLATEIVGRLVAVEVKPGDAVPFTADQIEQLQLAERAIRNGDFDEARNGLLAMLA
jgi:tRNA modification GTPase